MCFVLGDGIPLGCKRVVNTNVIKNKQTFLQQISPTINHRFQIIGVVCFHSIFKAIYKGIIFFFHPIRNKKRVI